MLNPHDRTSLLEALRPPPGYHFDSGVGTSFTLNLEALLTAPIAFTLFEVEKNLRPQEAASVNASQQPLEPVGLLESIRRYSERLTVFCQAGQIALPPTSRTIYAWLEDAVVEASTPEQGRLFHPKIWLCRYRDDDNTVLRLLCATRNLTFDSSLDTILVLESDAYEQRPSIPVPEQQAAADLVASLPGMGSREVPGERLRQINDLADDLRHVPLRPPEPFTELLFHTLGFRDSSGVLPETSDRAIAIAPFLGGGFLDRLTRQHSVEFLLSRQSSLDRIDPEILRRVKRIAVLNPNAGFETDEETDRDDEERETGPPSTIVHGLHAKLFAFDANELTSVFTGSANATDAAFSGNVEALVELKGPAGVIEALLADTPGEVGFDDLCIDYEIRDTPVVPDEDEERMALSLDRFRRQVATAGLQATVTTEEDSYRLTLTSQRSLPPIEAEGCSITVWPITLFEDTSATEVNAGSNLDASFAVSLEGITSFIACRIKVRDGQHAADSTFVINATLLNAPEDRHSKLLAALLRDPDRLVRYLLLLLSDDSDQQTAGLGGDAGGWLHRWQGKGWDEVPLLELLVRATSRHPERLDHIDALLTDLGDHRDETLPAGFDSIWEPIWQYRERFRS